MTENETKAVKFIQNIKDNAVVTLDHIAKKEPNVSPLLYKDRKEKASTILEMVGELLHYRAIGTAEEITRKLEELECWHTSEFNPDIKNVFANMSTQICHNCDHKDEYIIELEAEIEQYRAIGTVEECCAAMEKSRTT